MSPQCSPISFILLQSSDSDFSSFRLFFSFPFFSLVYFELFNRATHRKKKIQLLIRILFSFVILVRSVLCMVFDGRYAFQTRFTMRMRARALTHPSERNGKNHL